MKKGNVADFLSLILGICDLPDPQIYYMCNDKIQYIMGHKSGSSDFEICEFLKGNQTDTIQTYRPSTVGQFQTEYLFLLGIILDQQKDSQEFLFIFDRAEKIFTDAQGKALSDLSTLYKRDKNAAYFVAQNKRQQEGIELLNLIKSGTAKDLETRLFELLKFCTDYLNLDTGIISTIKDDQYEIYNIYPKSGPLQIGQQFELKKTYCGIAVDNNRLLAIDSMADSPYAEHSCYETFGFESYIGARYNSEHQAGTLSFSSRQARDKAFTSFDLEFIEHIAKMVAVIIDEDYNKKNRENEHNILYSFVKSAPAAIAMFDNDMRYIACSQNWISDYQISRDVIGLSHYEVFPEVSDSWKAIHQKALHGEIAKENEEKFERLDGSAQWIKWEVRPWFTNTLQIGGIVMFTADITEQVLQREKIRIARVETDKAAKLKEQFAYIASHDLQEPVRTILSLTKMLQGERIKNLDDTSKKMLGFINDSAARMSRLIKGLLDFSRLGKDKSLQLTDMNKLLNIVKQDLDQKIQETKTVIVNKGLPTLQVYPTEMRSMIQNLITNAIKFRKADRNPEIIIASGLEDGKYIFSFSDNGIGIQENYKQKIFQIFQRLNDQEKYEGQGIGLSHCNKIAELHRGTIWVEDNDQGGSVFKFTVDENLDILPEVSL